MPELRQYRYFVEIARRGSFTAASRTVHITQSALSEQIMQLERELDCRLFDRGRQGARLTPAGEALLPQAEQLLRLSGDIEQSVAHFGRPRRHALRIGMTVAPVLLWFPELVAEFEKRTPEVEIYVEDINTAEIYLRVSTGELDFGIVSVSEPALAGRAPAGIVATRLYEDELVLLVAPDHPFAELGAVPLTALRTERLIAFPQPFSLRLVTDELLRREGLNICATIESGWLDVAVGFVAAGVGVCIVPRSTMLMPGRADVRVVRIDAVDPPHRLLLALQRADGRATELIEQLLSLIQERLAPLSAAADLESPSTHAPARRGRGAGASSASR